MFGFIVKGIKAFGKGKAMLEAIDDDIDLDGVSEVDELKTSYEKIKSLGKELWHEVLNFFGVASGLVGHVAKAGK